MVTFPVVSLAKETVTVTFSPTLISSAPTLTVEFILLILNLPESAVKL